MGLANLVVLIDNNQLIFDSSLDSCSSLNQKSKFVLIASTNPCVIAKRNDNKCKHFLMRNGGRDLRLGDTNSDNSTAS